MLGAELFRDTRLSADGTISCASCHRPEHAFSDARKRAIGVRGREGTRNAPSLLDAGQRPFLFWDGRRDQLDRLVLDPLFNSREHGLRDATDLEERVGRHPPYRNAFARAFGAEAPIDVGHVASALTAYVSQLRSAKSKFDRFAFDGDSTALDTQQRAGYALFKGRAGCVACHRIEADAAPLTDDAFHNHGIGSDRLQTNLRATLARGLAMKTDHLGEAIQSDAEIAALGRFLVTQDVADIGAFRTPSLRNVALTAPYMHDGSIATLDEAIDHELYYAAADHGAGFSHEERQSIVAFLETLTLINGDSPRY